MNRFVYKLTTAARRSLLCFVVFAATFSSYAHGKKEVVALKNNLLYDAIATPNLQIEIRLTKQWTLELGGGFNPFPLKDATFPKWRHVMVSIAPRYWLCNAFHRDFISVNAAYVHYNVAGGTYPIGWMYPQVKNNRYQGDAVMAGASYGWHFAISPHFSIELEAGVDAGYSWYDRFECKHCGDKTESGGRWLVLPKLGVNLVVPLGGDEQSLARRCDCEKMDSKRTEDEQTEEAQAAETPIDKTSADTIQKKQAEEKRATKPRRGYIEEEPIEVAAVSKPASRAPRASQNDKYKAQSRRQYYSIEAFFYFDVDVKDIDSTYIRNEQAMRTIDRMLSDSLLLVTAVEVTGYASFDGSTEYNERLAGSRAQMIKEYLQITYDLKDDLFVLINAGEQWDDMEMRIYTEEFEKRDDVLQIIEKEQDPDRRERMIKKLNGGDTYRYMRDELKPIMRKLGKVTVYCHTIENQQTK